ncbi:GntR family transcriptional regulator [Acrocarpospora catenulata]|uniref:GntR family transcriptional regulator n=1 Tax=Acrocarpospora catenulata TaxID=2836182 RepID=UPI001BD9E741|nr:GntR family transcriptional regulator [Acrocarpospora catenulata]
MESQVISADWLAHRIAATSAREVSTGLARLIDSGEVPAGARLPTIRSLAATLNAKVSTVTDAWVLLRHDGLVETSRRGGTRVIGPRERGSSTAAATPFAGWAAVELIHALPDVALVPPTAGIFAAAVDPGRAMDHTCVIDRVLRSRLAESWPFPADSFAALPSGYAALRMTVRAALAGRTGVVAAQTPGLLRTASVIREVSGRALAVDGDEQGPLPESLDRALRAGAEIFVYQPCGQVPLGVSLTPERRDALADVIAGHGARTLIVEEDAAAGLFRGATLGARFPERTVRISQYWRAFGGDLAVTVVGGAPAVVDRLREEQRGSGVRVGGLLQSVLASLLADRDAWARAAAAGEVYTRRHAALQRALRRRDLRVSSRGGLFAWIPVRGELGAVADLAALGIRVVAGGNAWLEPDPEPHIRIATTRLPDDPNLVEDLAAAVATVASGLALVDVE